MNNYLYNFTIYVRVYIIPILLTYLHSSTKSILFLMVFFISQVYFRTHSLLYSIECKHDYKLNICWLNIYKDALFILLYVLIHNNNNNNGEIN